MPSSNNNNTLVQSLIDALSACENLQTDWRVACKNSCWIGLPARIDWRISPSLCSVRNIDSIFEGRPTSKALFTCSSNSFGFAWCWPPAVSQISRSTWVACLPEQSFAFASSLWRQFSFFLNSRLRRRQSLDYLDSCRVCQSDHHRRGVIVIVVETQWVWMGWQTSLRGYWTGNGANCCSISTTTATTTTCNR